MANLKNTTIDDTGFFRLPVGSSNQRPSSPQVGMTRTNTDAANTPILEFYDGVDWVQFAPEPVGSANNPFRSVSDLGSGSGIQPLFTTFGGRTDATPVLVDFDAPNGPYILVSFRFDQGNWVNVNSTVAIAGDDNSNGYGKISDSVNLNLGWGTRNYRSQWHPTRTYNEDSSSDRNNVFYIDNNYYRDASISYYNHATDALFTAAQTQALREWAQEINDDTPHYASTVDTDNGQTRPYNSNFNRITAGHFVWIESSGQYLGATPLVDTGSDGTGHNLWTENSYRFFTTSGTRGNNPGSGAGISDITSELLIPERVYFDIQTGGGAAFGTPYSPNARQGQGNFLNNRTFFLVRD